MESWKGDTRDIELIWFSFYFLKNGIAGIGNENGTRAADSTLT